MPLNLENIYQKRATAF